MAQDHVEHGEDERAEQGDHPDQRRERLDGIITRREAMRRLGLLGRTLNWFDDDK